MAPDSYWLGFVGASRLTQWCTKPKQSRFTTQVHCLSGRSSRARHGRNDVSHSATDPLLALEIHYATPMRPCHWHTRDGNNRRNTLAMSTRSVLYEPLIPALTNDKACRFNYLVYSMYAAGRYFTPLIRYALTRLTRYNVLIDLYKEYQAARVLICGKFFWPPDFSGYFLLKWNRNRVIVLITKVFRETANHLEDLSAESSAKQPFAATTTSFFCSTCNTETFSGKNARSLSSAAVTW